MVSFDDGVALVYEIVRDGLFGGVAFFGGIFLRGSVFCEA